jgi:hypothetical protein
VAPEIEKPEPETVAELIVTEPVPVELRVTDCVVAVLTDTLPKVRLDAPTLRVGTTAFNWIPKVSGVPPTLADNVAVCALVTEDTVAEKVAVFVPEVTVTDEGTVTAALLLDRFTAYPLLAAEALSATLQLSAPDPVKDAVVHVKAVSVGMPVPLSAIGVEAPLDELLARLSCPVTPPAREGLNCTVSVVDCPGFRVIGKLAPDREKPVPVMAAELMVSAAAPVELNVNVCVVGVLTATFPNAIAVALTASVGAATSTCTLKFSVTPPAVAVSVTLCAIETFAIVALKLALVAPSAMVTEAGIETAGLLLARFTTTPPLGAADERETVHGSVPGPATTRLQVRLLSVGGVGAVEMPVPLKRTMAVPFVTESLVTVN